LDQRALTVAMKEGESVCSWETAYENRSGGVCVIERWKAGREICIREKQTSQSMFFKVL